jgi:hypothetical protein
LTDNLGTVRDLAEYNSGTDITTIAEHRVEPVSITPATGRALQAEGGAAVQRPMN